MALDSYTGLKASVADFLNRTDLTSTVPDFIVLAETQIKRRLRCRRMVARADASFDMAQEFVAVPSRMIGPRTLILETDPITELDYLDEDVFLAEKKADRYRTCPTAVPRFYTVVGGELRLYPVPSVAYTGELSYWEAPLALGDTNQSNWVLANYPDIYLYGALTQSAPYLKDDASAATWGLLFTQAIADANAADPVPTSKSRLRTDIPCSRSGWRPSILFS